MTMKTIMRRRHIVACAVVGLVGATSAGANAFAPSDYTYVGPAGATAGSTAYTQLDGNPTGLGLGGVQVNTTKPGRLEISVADESGLPVAARITVFLRAGGGFTFVECDATSLTTQSLTGAAKVYVSPLLGPCGEVVSAPTRGVVSIESGR
jgi:hypothetical protein